MVLCAHLHSCPVWVARNRGLMVQLVPKHWPYTHYDLRERGLGGGGAAVHALRELPMMYACTPCSLLMIPSSEPACAPARGSRHPPLRPASCAPLLSATLRCPQRMLRRYRGLVAPEKGWTRRSQAPAATEALESRSARPLNCCKHAALSFSRAFGFGAQAVLSQQSFSAPKLPAPAVPFSLISSRTHPASSATVTP